MQMVDRLQKKCSRKLRHAPLPILQMSGKGLSSILSEDVSVYDVMMMMKVVVVMVKSNTSLQNVP